MSPDPQVAKIERAVLSTSSFSPRAQLDTIARHLRTIKATGKLVVNFSQGGVNTVTFEARHALNGSDHIEIVFDNDMGPAPSSGTHARK